MSEIRVTERRQGINQRNLAANYPKPDKLDFIDKGSVSLEWCSIAQFEQRMAVLYPDWNAFIIWTDAKERRSSVDQTDIQTV